MQQPYKSQHVNYRLLPVQVRRDKAIYHIHDVLTVMLSCLGHLTGCAIVLEHSTSTPYEASKHPSFLAFIASAGAS